VKNVVSICIDNLILLFQSTEVSRTSIRSIFIREQLLFVRQVWKKHRGFSLTLNKITRPDRRALSTKLILLFRDLFAYTHHGQIKYPSEIGLSTINFALTSHCPRSERAIIRQSQFHASKPVAGIKLLR